jgi:ATP-dependent exoDNAse (exonuclease V) beta subunit
MNKEFFHGSFDSQLRQSLCDDHPGWKRVKVANDFRFKTVDGRLMLDENEMRLLYVAVTRAQHVLDISELREDLIRLFNSRR